MVLSQEISGDGSTDATADDEQLKQCLVERDEYLQGWQRARADYDNLLKRINGERELVRTSSVQDVFKNLLSVVDHFECALKHIPESLQKDTWVEGVVHIKRAWDDFLQQTHIERIATVGELFDPHLHEAMAEHEHDDKPPGTILEEVESGYIKDGHVLRAAKVIIATKKKI